MVKDMDVTKTIACDTLTVTEVAVKPIKGATEGDCRLLALAEVVIDGVLVIRNYRVLYRNGRLWVGEPLDTYNPRKVQKTVSYRDSRIQDMIEDSILEVYHKILKIKQDEYENEDES